MNQFLIVQTVLIIFTFSFSINCGGLLGKLKRGNKEGEEVEGCPICLKKFDKKSEQIAFHSNEIFPITTPNHYFHKECIDRWNNPYCPLCRSPKDPFTTSDCLLKFCSKGFNVTQTSSLIFSHFDHWILDSCQEAIKKALQECLKNDKRVHLDFLVSKIDNLRPDLYQQIQVLIINQEEFKGIAKRISIPSLLVELSNRYIPENEWRYFLKLNDQFWDILRILGSQYFDIFIQSCIKSGCERLDIPSMKPIWKELFNSHIDKHIKQEWLVDLAVYYDLNEPIYYKYEIERAAPWDLVIAARKIYNNRINK